MRVLPDTRFQPYVSYEAPFLWWWGILLYCCKLGSRRQLDYELRDLESLVLSNINRLAGTQQESLPVNKTLVHFIGHVGVNSFAALRTLCIRRLIRMKALDDCRLLGAFVVALDGTGYLHFHHEHCPRCLTRRSGETVLYLHPVLEAKLVDPAGLALSVATEFIENSEARDVGRSVADYQQHKQDCELKAFGRLALQLKHDFPQMRLCISGDSEFACGTGMQVCEDNGWSFVLVFKAGRTPALWAEFESLLELQSEHRRVVHLPAGTRQEYRWVNGLPYTDSEGRTYQLDAIICTEDEGQQQTTYAWLTNMSVTPDTVVAIATKGGRVRAKIENQGFNMQKRHGMNLEHAYSTDPDTMKAFYLLLQIGHTILQMVEMGSLLKNLAGVSHTTPCGLFGSLKNIARRLLECLRYIRIPDEAFDTELAAACYIRLNTS